MDDGIEWENADEIDWEHGTREFDVADSLESHLLFADESDEYYSEEEDFAGGVEHDILLREDSSNKPTTSEQSTKICGETAISGTASQKSDEPKAVGKIIEVKHSKKRKKEQKLKQLEEQRKRQYMRHKRRVRQVERHKLSLLCGLAKLLSLRQLLDHTELNERVRQILPARVMKGAPYHTRTKLMLLLNWFNGSFEVKKLQRNHGALCSSEHLSHLYWCIQEHAADPLTLLLLVAVAIKLGGSPLRLVSPLSCLPLRLGPGPSPAASATAASSDQQKPDMRWSDCLLWIEHPVSNASDSDQVEWMMIDPLTQLATAKYQVGFNKVLSHRYLDPTMRSFARINPSKVPLHTLVRKFPYIVAMGLTAVDVSPRYHQNWSQVALHRLGWEDEWLTKQVLCKLESELSAVIQKQPTNILWSFNSPKSIREEKQALSNVVRQQIPKSLEGIKKHPDVFLEQQLRKNQVICPGAVPVGYHAGLPLYSASDVKLMLSRNKWRLQGREVLESDLENPHKVVARRKRGGESAADIDRLADNKEKHTEEVIRQTRTLKLYAEWQTVPISIPDVGPDGKIPKNEFGNIEMLSLALIPRGASHISENDQAYAAQACEKLKIDYAPALVGFDYSYERTRPRFDGVIVATFNVPIVLEECARIEIQEKQKAKEEKYEKVCSTWHRLVRALTIKDELKQKYQTKRKRVQKACTEAIQGAKKGRAKVELQNRLGVCQHQFKVVDTDSGEEQCEKCGAIQEVI